MSTSSVITSSGITLGISLPLPTAHTIPDFEALSYTAIGEIIGAGDSGKVFDPVEYAPLSSRENQTLKGNYTQEPREISLGRDRQDAGQALIITAMNDYDICVAFKLTYQNGDITYFTALVFSYAETTGDGGNNIVGANSTLNQQLDSIYLVATGVLTATINAGGTFTGITDGTFPATQASTSGVGTGAEFSVTLVAGAVTAAAVTKTGSGYVVADTVNLLVTGGPTESVAAVLDVATIVTAL